MTSLYVFVSFGLVLQIVKGIIVSIGQIYPPIGNSFSESIGYYIISVFMYGIMYTVTKGINIKHLTIHILKYIFSKRTVYLLTILLVISAMYNAIIGLITQHIIQNILSNSMFGETSIFNFIEPLSMPIWYYWIGWIIKGIVTSIILVYVRISSITD